MLVLKIKPCMCKYKLFTGETANGSLYQLLSLERLFSIWIALLIVELIHGQQRPGLSGSFTRNLKSMF